ncbi:MAG: M14 family metallopeptidase [Bacteroidota bacterium]
MWHFSVQITHEEVSTTVPVTVFHGATDGPVLGITAGVHGYEYAPILAAQGLIKSLDPTTLKGTVILVQIANVESFLGRSPYLNPLDGKNLNRSFPGSAAGSITERIADYLSKEVIARCDYFVDMHSGDAPEDLMPYAAYYQHDSLPEVSQKGRQMVASMGFDHVVVFQTTGKEYMSPSSPSLYCSAEAFKQGIPAVDIECGRLGRVEPTYVHQIEEGIHRLLHSLEMQPIGPKPKSGETIFISERSYLSSSHTGIFYPAKTHGEYVVAGMKIGHITNFFNETVEEVFADTNGIILYILGTPPVNEGETLVAIGMVDE